MPDASSREAEYLKQDQLRNGTDKTSPAEISAHHEEIKTINRNALLGLEYGFAPDWSAGLVLPFSNREHLHIDNHHGTPIPEAWQFDDIGDARVTLRYQPAGRHAGDASWSLQGGLKLPTGKTDVHNADGDVAERSVQPGSGTTDLLLGGGLAYAPLSLPGSLFANLALPGFVQRARWLSTRLAQQPAGRLADSRPREAGPDPAG